MRVIAFLSAGAIGLGIFLSGILISPTILPQADSDDFSIITEKDLPPLVATTTSNQPPSPPPSPAPEETPDQTDTEVQEPPETKAPGVSVSTTTATSTPEEVDPLSPQQLNEKTRSVTVNILCEAQTQLGRRLTTGSGVLIDSRGVVLTNAHVAYLLLYDSGTVSCQVRNGAPAEFLYTPQLLYLSTSWVHENKDELSEESPKGTGEHDYALLIPTEPIDPQPYLAIGDPEDLSSSLEVFLGAYPAGFLGGATVERDLYPATASTRIYDFFTFGEGTIDLASLGSTILAQKGSSGGPVVDPKSGSLIGIIVTTTEGETTGDRNLHAVLTNHINRSLESELGEGLESYISGNIWIRAEIFNRAIVPALQVFLENN